MSQSQKHSILHEPLLILNVVAAGMLLLSYWAQKESPSQHAFVAALGLIYPVLVIANLLFVVLWLLRRNFLWVLSLVILLLGYEHLKTNFALHLSSGQKKEKAYKILSYNVQGFAGRNEAPYRPEIKAKILTFLLRQHPDILCLQEYSGKKTDLFQKNSSEHAVFYSYYTRKGSKNTGLVIVTPFPIFRHHKLKFKGYRTFGIYADMVAGKDTLRVINVHLASISLKQNDLDLLSGPPSAAWKKQDVKHHFADIYHKIQKAFRLRERQTGLLVQTIQSSPYPVIVCGDFNDTPSSRAYFRIASLLQDAFVKKGWGTGVTYAGPLPLLRIDYLFADKKLDILSFKKYPVRLSDHFPISMEISEKPASQNKTGSSNK